MPSANIFALERNSLDMAQARGSPGPQPFRVVGVKG
jgi:hypothetical protein